MCTPDFSRVTFATELSTNLVYKSIFVKYYNYVSIYLLFFFKVKLSIFIRLCKTQKSDEQVNTHWDIEILVLLGHARDCGATAQIHFSAFCLNLPFVGSSVPFWPCYMKTSQRTGIPEPAKPNDIIFPTTRQICLCSRDWMLKASRQLPHIVFGVDLFFELVDIFDNICLNDIVNLFSRMHECQDKSEHRTKMTAQVQITLLYKHACT